MTLVRWRSPLLELLHPDPESVAAVEVDEPAHRVGRAARRTCYDGREPVANLPHDAVAA